MNFLSIIAMVTKYLPSVEVVIQELVKLVQTQTPHDVSTNPNPVVKVTNPSETVKGLQQLLNNIVKPSPNIKVDGIYGPATDAALRAGLKMAGIQL